MRHILGQVGEFGEFSAELGDVAEVVVGAALNICLRDLERRYGQPRTSDGQPARLCACALGKCGGRELGYASDIELMFVYDGNGTTTGPETIGTTEFYQRFVEALTHTIRSREEGVFQVDLRLRPYGRAGSLAVSLDAFAGYFGPEGAAWPYERQALVKLRPIAGDVAFGSEIVALRDRLIYSGEPFDVAAMRAMREKQLRQLVKAGTTNAKLSPRAARRHRISRAGSANHARASRSVAAGGQHAQRARGPQRTRPGLCRRRRRPPRSVCLSAQPDRRASPPSSAATPATSPFRPRSPKSSSSSRGDSATARTSTACGTTSNATPKWSAN